MDRADAIRLVVFEYLLPANRKQRARVLQACLADERIDRDWHPSRHFAGIFEEMHLLSERLLGTHGFATSYVYPYTLRHAREEVNTSETVRALLDCDGPFVWNARCKRRADPASGIRVFQAKHQMCSGRLP
jgi:hypothetical protein